MLCQRAPEWRLGLQMSLFVCTLKARISHMQDVAPHGVAGEMNEGGIAPEKSLHFSRVLEHKGVSAATLMVGVRCRPLTKRERAAGMRTITRLVEDKVVIVMDPNQDMYRSVGLHRLRLSGLLRQRQNPFYAASALG